MNEKNLKPASVFYYFEKIYLLPFMKIQGIFMSLLACSLVINNY